MTPLEKPYRKLKENLQLWYDDCVLGIIMHLFVYDEDL